MIGAELRWFASQSHTARALRRATKAAQRRTLAVGRFFDHSNPAAGLAVACTLVAGCYACAMVFAGAW